MVRPVDEATLWNARQLSVLKSNKYMFEHRVACDVTFFIQYPEGGQPTRIPAHKYILYSRSPVFFAQFCGTMATSGEEITIVDIPSSAFLEVLR